MHQVPTKVLFALLGLAGGVGISSQLERQDDCPPPVTATAKRVLGDLSAAKIDKETDHGITTYEVAIKSKDGMVASVDVAESGELIAYEHQVAEATVPAAVREAFNKQHPGSKLLRVEQVEKHSFELLYEQDGKKHEVEILPSGYVPSAASKAEADEDDEKAADEKDGKKKDKKGGEPKK